MPASDGGDDFVGIGGPDEWFGFLVVLGEEAIDGGLEVDDAAQLSVTGRMVQVRGWGEGSLHGAVECVEPAIHELGARLIGWDPSGVERHWQRMSHAWRWRGGATIMTALGALDIALWDIEGKRLGVPVYRLLGGPFRERLRVYASHWLSGAKSPEEAREGAREAASSLLTALARGMRLSQPSPARHEPRKG